MTKNNDMDGIKNFFISRTGKDSQWAKWIAGTLENNDYTTIIQDWDFASGENIITNMDNAIKNTQATIVVWSKEYEEKEFCKEEWTATLANSFKKGSGKKLFIARVENHDINGILSARSYFNLFDLDEATATKELLKNVSDAPADRKDYIFPLNITPQKVVFPVHTDNSKDNEQSTNIKKEKPATLRGSIYSPVNKKELQRLEIQSEHSKNTDEESIKIALSDFKKEQPLNVLDVGCAYGFVGHNRFDSDRFINVVGIDKNAECINYAKDKFENDKFSYYQIDLTNNFSKDLNEIKHKKNIDGFDIVFIALVLHHLDDDTVYKILRIIREHMSSNGVIILRSSDDGSKLAYNDDGLLKKIINLTLKGKGVSDRFNGHKLYGYLFNADFKDIKIKSYMRDTTCFAFDQRRLLFKDSFSYRINYFQQNLESDPNNKEVENNFYEMQELLEKFENKFHKKDFWYCEYDYVGIAKK